MVVKEKRNWTKIGIASLGITALLLALVFVVAGAFGIVQLPQTAEVQGFSLTGKGGCDLIDDGCVTQYVVRVQQLNSQVDLIFDREDQIPKSLKVKDAVEFAGLIGPNPHIVYGYWIKKYEPNATFVPLGQPPPTPATSE